MEQKKCLNPKCQKEFTPKNAKGVYCGSNCRAAHAYQLKRLPISENKTVGLPKDYLSVNKILVLTEDGQTIDLKEPQGSIPQWANDWIESYVQSMNELHNEPILEQIEETKKEKVPQHRDTAMGRVAWESEKKKRIEELQKQLK